MKTNILLVACLGLSLSAHAADRQFTYAQNDDEVQYFGNSKAETYDVAVRISDPALAGKQITAVTVRLCEDATIGNPQGWISSALLLEKKKNAPDIALVDASVSEDNVLTAVFTEPYTLTDAGVYVGYSITIAKASTFGDQNPNPVSASSSPDGMYIHSTRTDLKWTSLAEHGVASMMEVTLSGDFASPAVSVTEVGDVRTDGKSPTVKVPVTLCNYGDEAVASLEYTCRFGEGEAQTSEVAAEIPAGFGVWQTLELDVPTYGATAPLTISVSRVNGKENTMAGASATGSYVLMAVVPQMRPLMEEYT
ncbi:MAG: hypothetical protein K2H03_08245, partial [Muribaculaceae bacterium]|nr:hypothetical protein [Muribaculaceae bacterium]